MTISFFVPGHARPAGSKRAFLPKGATRPNIVDTSGREGKQWRDRVAAFGMEAMAGRPPLDGPLWVKFVFTTARPKGHYGTGRNAGVVKPSAPAYPAGKPDVLKLARATEDALTGIVWRDDAQTVRLTVGKVYGNSIGVRVVVNTTNPFPPFGYQRPRQADTSGAGSVPRLPGSTTAGWVEANTRPATPVDPGASVSPSLQARRYKDTND